MTHVVTESCIRCRYTDCVDVCPVDCFRVGPNFLAIDPDECIDCAVCVAECPVNAIFSEEDVPANQQEFIKINAELSQSWPSITKTIPHWQITVDAPTARRTITFAEDGSAENARWQQLLTQIRASA